MVRLHEVPQTLGCPIAAIRPDCKSDGFGLRRFESYRPNHNMEFVVQLAERWNVDPEVAEFESLLTPLIAPVAQLD